MSQLDKYPLWMVDLMKMKELSKVPIRGIAYHLENGVEIGSIIIRPEHIAFIAGKWCKQISRKTKRSAIVALAREHEQRIKGIRNKTNEKDN